MPSVSVNVRTGGSPVRADSSGFTLVELLVVVALIGIVVLISVPFLVHVIQRDRLASPASQILLFLQQTKLEAIRRNTTIGVDVNPTGGPNGRPLLTAFIDSGGGGCAAPPDEKYNANCSEALQPTTRWQYEFPSGVALRVWNDATRPNPGMIACSFPSDAANGLNGGGPFRVFFRPDGSVSASSQGNIPLVVLSNPLSAPDPSDLTANPSRGELYVSNSDLAAPNGFPKNTFRIQIESAITGRLSTVKLSRDSSFSAVSFVRSPFPWYY
jgi:prepilin-type N-terminal cleavage/methylation domain-containing protein